MKKYQPRIADHLLQEKLEGMGAVLIEGPKWCGKTTTAEQQANSVLYMDNPRDREQNLQAASIKEGAKTLKTLSAKIDTTKMKEPSFMMILTATGNYAFRRTDGVCVVPIGCLKD